MVLSKDDLAVIVACFTEKGWTSNGIAKEFPNKKWNLSYFNDNYFWMTALSEYKISNYLATIGLH